MLTRWIRIATFALAAFLLAAPAPAVQKPLPQDEGASGLALALRKLPNSASFLHVTAHPDDEDNPLLVLLARGRGIHTGLLTLTRGDGGQNEIGPELFEALGIIRTEELMSMHRYDGAEQFFSRAYEFGYSFSVEETMQRWGREEIVADVVRILRTFRPDVVATLPRTGVGGGQHHQASALIAEEAFRAAADPHRFPEQIAEGLRPWQAKKLYERHRWGAAGDVEDDDRAVVSIDCGGFDPILGTTYYEFGMESRSLHRCQGMRQIVPLPGRCASNWKLVDSAIQKDRKESDLFDGIDTELLALERFAAGELERAPFLRPSLKSLQSDVTRALDAFDANDPSRSASPLAEGLRTLRQLIEQVETSDLSDSARFEILLRLRRKESEFLTALRHAHQLRLDAVVDEGLVSPSQLFDLTVNLANGSHAPVTVRNVELRMPQGWMVIESEDPIREVPAAGVAERRYRIRVARDAEPTRPYWIREEGADRYRLLNPNDFGKPWPDAALQVRVHYDSNGESAWLQQAAQYPYEGPWVGGEQRHELMVVPKVSVRAAPEISVVPLDQAREGREVRVTVDYNGEGPASGRLNFRLPDGWEVRPPSADLEFEGRGESATRRFFLSSSETVTEGEHVVGVEARFGDQVFREGHEFIDYHHIEKRVLYHPSEVELKTVDVRVADGVRLGYVMGVGDQVPQALNQLGIEYSMMTEDDVAFGDLDRFNVIVTGVRAYLNRKDLRAYNDRLLDWVRRGGVMIVQYNKFEMNSFEPDTDGQVRMGPSQFAPHPLQVGRGRVTDQNAPVEILIPGHPVFHFPNRISERDWDGWSQERGLYFIGEKSPHYRDLISMEDPFEYNAGEQLGSLVEARYGQGRWIYLGIGLWRQLPAGVPGAYRLLANLVSLGSPDAPSD